MPSTQTKSNSNAMTIILDCKFAEKCRFQHFYELCAKKYAGILSVDLYILNHVNLQKNVEYVCKHNKNKEAEKGVKEVKELELEVSTLKKVLEDKGVIRGLSSRSG